MDVYVLPVMNPDGYHYTWTNVRRHKTTTVKVGASPLCLTPLTPFLMVFRTGCGGRTDQPAAGAVASALTSTETLTPTGAVGPALIPHNAKFQKCWFPVH